MNEKTSVQLVDNSSDINTELLIQQAIEKNVSVETMEKLLAMRMQLKQEWAKEQFIKAMAKFQGECPVIKKTKIGAKTNQGEIAYHYAPIDAIIEQTKQLISGNGFSFKIDTEYPENGIKIFCIVTHIAGHSETTTVSFPHGKGTNIMSAPQIVASTMSFGKRYVFCNAFGIITGDDDNDCNNQERVDPAKFETETMAIIKTANKILKYSNEKVNDFAKGMFTNTWTKLTVEQKRHVALALKDKAKEKKDGNKSK